MTIQLPVLLWTIILFVVLMLVLNKLLFKPFFKVMDARKARVEAAKAAHGQHLEQLEAAKKAAQEAEEHREAEHAKLIAAQNAEAEEYAARLISDARHRQREALDAYAKELEQEKSDMLAQINDGLDSIAEKTAVRLTQ